MGGPSQEDLTHGLVKNQGSWARSEIALRRVVGSIRVSFERPYWFSDGGEGLCSCPRNTGGLERQKVLDHVKGLFDQRDELRVLSTLPQERRCCAALRL